MRYESRGEVPAKRHMAVRQPGGNGHRKLLVEEVMGYEGFSGNETILYHLHSPCRLDDVGAFTPIVREEWVPDTHVHRLADTRPIDAGGDPLACRRLLMWNSDIEVWVAKPDAAMPGYYRNGEGDEVVYVHRGEGVVRTVFGLCLEHLDAGALLLADNALRQGEVVQPKNQQARNVHRYNELVANDRRLEGVVVPVRGSKSWIENVYG